MKVMNWVEKVTGSELWKTSTVVPVRSSAKAAPSEVLFSAHQESMVTRHVIWLLSYVAYMKASKEPDPLAYVQ